MGFNIAKKMRNGEKRKVKRLKRDMVRLMMLIERIVRGYETNERKRGVICKWNG